MRHEMIDSPEQLDTFWHAMNSAHVIAIDTEFVRVRTYYPRFCLLQICVGDIVYCVDPVALDLDVDELREILVAEDKIKVLHAARQDLEVFYLCCKVVPKQIFDTQIAAAMIGLGDQLGYASLVETVTGVKLKKAQTRTDWCRRPLSSAQLEYAFDDVRYLEDIYDYLTAELTSRGRLSWLLEECGTLSREDLYRSDPDLAYRRLGHGRTLAPVAQCILKELAIWREKVSQNLDLPRNWLVKDKVLEAIAVSRPQTAEQLSGIAGVAPKFVRRYSEEILSLIDEKATDSFHPVIWEQKPPLDPDQRALRKQVIQCLKRVASDTGISSSLLGSRDDVTRLVRGSTDVSMLQGWRAQLLGAELNTLLA